MTTVSSEAVSHAASSGTAYSNRTPADVIASDSRVAAPFIAEKCKREAPKHWDRFYRTHETRFFADRHWTTREFEDLDALAESELAGSSSPMALLEVGCGVGNTIFPLIERFPSLRVYACDFADKAIELVQSHPAYASSGRVTAFVHDLTDTTTSLASRIDAPVDIVTCLFVLSAIPPEKLNVAVKAMADALRPGGVLLLREHAREDSAQLRFHTRKSAGYSEPSLLSADRPLYRRADWTLMLFLGTEEIDALMTECGLEGRSKIVTQEIKNRKQEVTIQRRFVQGRFVKRA